MKVTISGKQMNVFEETKELIREKLAKLDRYFDDEGSATVLLSRKRNISTLELTIRANGTLFRCESEADTFRDALDKSIDTVIRQIRKHKTKLAKRLRDGAFAEEPTFREDDEEDGEVAMRVKEFEYSPMSVEEAIMQMNLLGHQFYIFNDASNGDTCVVYARRDGGYGLIVPKK